MARRRSMRKSASRTGTAPAAPEINPQLQAAIMEVIDTQLRERTPPETWQTLERLVEVGYTAEGARQLIAHAVVSEIFAVMASGRPYDQTRYLAALRRLPKLPGEQ